jgi:hypothetical protein
MMKNYELILRDLFKSKSTGNVISLKLKGYSKKILTAVQDVKANRIVVLNPISVYGSQLEESIFHLEDIENSRVYSARYHDPIYVRIRELKNNIDQIRKNFNF